MTPNLASTPATNPQLLKSRHPMRSSPIPTLSIRRSPLHERSSSTRRIHLNSGFAFPGGDPNCTAASVTVLTETPEQINIELLVGITTDALARSCLADEFILRVEVPLNEAATGKAISWTQPSDSDEAPLVTPDLSTDDFLGLTEAEAAAIAEENAIVWRVTRIDDSSNGVTDDFNPGRLNFQIDDGIITSVSLG